MLYTVKEVSTLSKVTIKTLHHYHKIGLLVPCEISEAGYRLYGTKELERLQQILFYKEMDFPLPEIKKLIDGEPDRRALLSEQEKLLLARKERLENIIRTLQKSIVSMENNESMDPQDMFAGFESAQEWREALEEQNDYLKNRYDVDIIGDNPIDVTAMNEQAKEAMLFMKGISEALRNGLKQNDEQVRQLIRSHLDFLNEHGHQTSAADFALQARFFLQDDFHLRMLEDQQTGLAYYLSAAAESFAADHP